MHRLADQQHIVLQAPYFHEDCLTNNSNYSIQKTKFTKCQVHVFHFIKLLSSFHYDNFKCVLNFKKPLPFIYLKFSCTLHTLCTSSVQSKHLVCKVQMAVALKP